MMTSNHKIDFAIITALPVELDAVLSKLGHYEAIGRKSDRLPFYQAEIGQAQVLVTRSEAGNIKAALAAATLLERYQPEYLLMVGIAAGFEGKVELGDVVVAESCYYDGPGKDTSDGKLPAPRQIPTGLLLARSKEYKTLDWKENIHVQSPASSQQPNIHHGVIASSETVIGEKRKMASLLATHRELRAVAMEGYGVAEAAFGNKVDFLEIRGICDLGDENKDDKWHKYAADVAAAYAVGLLRYIESGVFQSLPTGDAASQQDTTLLAKLQQIEQAVEALRQERVATSPSSLTEAEEIEQAIQQEIKRFKRKPVILVDDGVERVPVLLVDDGVERDDQPKILRWLDNIARRIGIT